MDKEFTFEEMWDYQIESQMLKEDNNSHIWKKTVARFFWDEQQRKIEKLKKANKLAYEALAWLSDIPSDDVLHDMKKPIIISLFKLNQQKAQRVLSHLITN